ncbi:hypothetical protein LJC46_01305 [Desulfovibrio sp. OttesenSCG-928-G15]|nr:hypothetical protein [Desulfovibrio sp. OttesenSCG-928-G15]
MRLDAALALMLPKLGLRARRRLWQSCLITVNGTPRSPGYTVFPGDTVRIDALPGKHDQPAPAQSGQVGFLPRCAKGTHANTADIAQAHSPTETGPAILYTDAQLIAFFKPSGLHTAHISGSPLPSLEAMLAPLSRVLPPSPSPVALQPPPLPWPPSSPLPLCDLLQSPLPTCEQPDPPILLTRLDAQTSGIVLAARSKKSGLLFRQAELAGRVTKNYMALVRGELAAPLAMTRRLNMRNRTTTTVLEEDEPDGTRHTQATPLRLLLPEEKEALAAVFPGVCSLPEAVTLVEVSIHRGARHQIRAHLAHAGFPLLGETLYAQGLCDAPHPLYLHHARVRLNLENEHEITVEAKAPWPFLSCQADQGHIH